MTVLPILERELRVALRKHQPVRRRLRFAAACAGGALLFILLSGFIASGTASADLHQLLCLVGLYIVGRAPQLTAGIFAQERREQTLGLLILSGLSAGEVFFSKLFSAAALGRLVALRLFWDLGRSAGLGMASELEPARSAADDVGEP